MQATHAMHATYSYRSSATISGTTPTQGKRWSFALESVA